MKAIKTRIHWNRQEKRWTAKTSKGCPRFPYILVKGGWETEVKPHLKSNPKGFVLTTDNKVSFLDKEQAEEILQKHNPIRLVYDKANLSFNVTKGDSILFIPDGAYILF